MKLLNPDAIERLPPAFRFLFGCIMASLAIAITYYVYPLRAFPLILAFPTVVFAEWFVGMWGAAGCALADVVLVDMFLTRREFRLVTGSAYEEVRIALFLSVSLLLGWSIRRLSQQREELRNRDLQEKLMRAELDRRLAEERARTVEALGNREEMLRMALRANGMGLWVWDLTKTRCTGLMNCFG
jgi:K+-sensing histidine kinase KdpD